MVDKALEVAQERMGEIMEGCSFGALDITDKQALSLEIGKADITISMVPAHMHMSVAKSCLEHNSHLITASYLTKEMEALNAEALTKGLVFLNECGLDPGIDHMSLCSSSKRFVLRVVRSAFRKF